MLQPRTVTGGIDSQIYQPFNYGGFNMEASIMNKDILYKHYFKTVLDFRDMTLQQMALGPPTV